MTTAAGPTQSAKAAFDKALEAIPFDPLNPPTLGPGEQVPLFIARVFGLPSVDEAHDEGRAIDEAHSAIRGMRGDAYKTLNGMKRAIQLAALRNAAAGKVPTVDAKAVAKMAAARDYAEYLDAMQPTGAHDSPVREERAWDAVYSMPRSDAAGVLILAHVLRAHEQVRQSLRMRPTREGVPSASMMLGVISRERPRPCWLRQASHEDRQEIVALDRAAREWVDGYLVPAVEARLGV
jgi:hypothetical protein